MYVDISYRYIVGIGTSYYNYMIVTNKYFARGHVDDDDDDWRYIILALMKLNQTFPVTTTIFMIHVFMRMFFNLKTAILSQKYSFQGLLVYFIIPDNSNFCYTNKYTEFRF